MQVTYHGHPLYTYARDTAAGQTKGEAVSAFGARWYAVSAAGTAVHGTSSTTTTATTTTTSTTTTTTTTTTAPPPARPVAGRYCGFTGNGSGICFDVTAGGQFWANGHFGVLNATCQPGSTGFDITFDTTGSAPIAADLSFNFTAVAGSAAGTAVTGTFDTGGHSQRPSARSGHLHVQRRDAVQLRARHGLDRPAPVVDVASLEACARCTSTQAVTPHFSRSHARTTPRCLADPELNHPFSRGDQHPQHVERLAAYWAEVMGGPAVYSQSCGDESSVLQLHAGNGDMSDLGERFVALLPAGARRCRSSRRPGVSSGLGRITCGGPLTTCCRTRARTPSCPPGAAMPRWGWDGLQVEAN